LLGQNQPLFDQPDEPAVVYGHSLGGEVGVMLAAQHPELVCALIVGDAPLSISDHATEHPAHRAQNTLCISSIRTCWRRYSSDRASCSRAMSRRSCCRRSHARCSWCKPIRASATRWAITTWRWAFRLLRNVTHVRVDGLGHPLHAIQPARMAELFQAFLTGCKRGAGKFGNGFLRAVIVDERFAGGGRGNECGDDGKLKPLRRGDHQALRIADAQARRPPGCVIW
jgi:hypothetical protein